MIADCGRMRALDLVEVNPTLDLRNTTAEFAAELALSALGKGIFSGSACVLRSGVRRGRRSRHRPDVTR